MAMTAQRDRGDPLVGQQALLDLTYSVGAAALLGGSHAGPVSNAANRARMVLCLIFRKCRLPFASSSRH